MPLTREHAEKVLAEYEKWTVHRKYTEEILVMEYSVRQYWLCYGSGPSSRATPYLVVRTNGCDIYTLLNFVNFCEMQEVHGIPCLVMGDKESSIALEIKD